MNRRSLTPAAGLPIEGILAQRRALGGARREVSARLVFRSPEARELEGWALNISRGGIRVLVEESVELGDVYELAEQDNENPILHAHKARVVWVQNEPDGTIAGLEFLDVEPGHRVPGPPGNTHPPSSPPSSMLGARSGSSPPTPGSSPPPRPGSTPPIRIPPLKPMSSPPPPPPPDSEPPKAL